jgi:hypothetical protein
VQEASRLADQGQHDGALRLFQRAYEQDPQPGYLYDIGVECEALGRDGEALEAFEQFLTHPGTTPRSFVTHASDERRDLRKRVGEMDVHGAPPGAQISVDDRARGTSPGPIPLSPGPHRLVVEAQGFAPFSKTVDIVAGSKMVVEAVLRAEGGGGAALTAPGSASPGLIDAGASPASKSLEESGPARRRRFYGSIAGGAGLWAAGVPGSPPPAPAFGVSAGAVVAALGPGTDFRLGARVGVAFLSEPTATDRFFSILVDPSVTFSIAARWAIVAELGAGVQVLSGIPNDSILLVQGGGRVTGDLGAFEVRPGIGVAYALTEALSVRVGPAMSVSSTPSSRFEHGSIVRAEIVAGFTGEL